jgi:hypothetical protein
MSIEHPVTTAQRLRWQPIGYPMHFIGRRNCAFRLATLIESKVVVSSIGSYQPTANGGIEPLGGATCAEDEMFFETYVFAVQRIDNGMPIIGEQLFAERCRTAQEAYKLHHDSCMKFQYELAMGMHR